MHVTPAPPIVGPTRCRSGHDPTRPAAATFVAALLMATAAAGGPDPLATPVSALWTSVPLRDWADRAAALAKRPVVVDRRLDPDVTVTRDCRDEPLGAVLAAVADAAGAVVEPLRSSIRLAPPGVAGRAANGERIREGEIARLPASARAALAVRRPWSWADGARPRDLITAVMSEAGLALAGIEAVPHDHLAGAALPPLTLAERVDLVLAHYDLRIAWSAAGGRAAGWIIPLEPAAAAAAGHAPRPTARPRPRGIERFSLQLEAPLDEALAALAARLGLEVDIDSRSLAARGILPGEIVRATVADATREQLLDAVVAPLGLRWRIEGRRLVVDAAPP